MHTFIASFSSQGSCLPTSLPRLTRQWSGGVDPCLTREMLIKQLTWEGLNVPTHNAVAAIHNKDINKWATATRDIDPSNGPIAALRLPLGPFLLADNKGWTFQQNQMTGHAGSVAVLATYEGTAHWSNWKLGAWDAIRVFIGPRTAVPRLRFLQIGCSSAPQVRGSPANPKIIWVLLIFSWMGSLSKDWWTQVWMPPC